jgi:hypothetical protein
VIFTAKYAKYAKQREIGLRPRRCNEVSRFNACSYSLNAGLVKKLPGRGVFVGLRGLKSLKGLKGLRSMKGFE